MRVMNPDDILAPLWGRLNGDQAFRSTVQLIAKGRDRGDPPAGKTRVPNPSAAVFLLTAPLDAETSVVSGTAVVNVYMDDLHNGRADVKGLGQRAKRVQELFHRCHEKAHPIGPIVDPYVEFLTLYAVETLILKSDIEGEHVASVSLSYRVRAKELVSDG